MAPFRGTYTIEFGSGGNRMQSQAETMLPPGVLVNTIVSLGVLINLSRQVAVV